MRGQSTNAGEKMCNKRINAKRKRAKIFTNASVRIISCNRHPWYERNYDKRAALAHSADYETALGECAYYALSIRGSEKEIISKSIKRRFLLSLKSKN